jgi:hypothetical protein
MGRLLRVNEKKKQRNWGFQGSNHSLSFPGRGASLLKNYLGNGANEREE